MSNISWAYATFKSVANHIVALRDLSRFMPQEMSSISWAYAIAGELHPWLFKRFAKHRRVERLEWVQFSRPFQYHVGVCNRGQVKSSALEMLRQSHHRERLEWV
jgi:hypothetical protein